MPQWDADLYPYCNLETAVIFLGSFTPADLAMCVAGMPKLRQLIYSDERKFDMLGWTVNMNGHEITWNSAADFVEHLQHALFAEMQTRRLVLSPVANLIAVKQSGYFLSQEWMNILGSEHCTTADVEHYLQSVG